MLRSMTKKKGFTHESSINQTYEWYTPRWIFDALKVEFDLDPCTSLKANEIVQAKRALGIQHDGLASTWYAKEFVWLNPPYGKETGKWLEKLSTHPGGGVALVFCRPDTQWFHSHVVGKAEALLFFKGRVRFIDGRTMKEGGTPGAASMLIGYGRKGKQALKNASHLGSIWYPS